MSFFHLLGHQESEVVKFFNHYEANGWRQAGKVPIINWPATALKWILNIHPIQTPKNGKRAKPENLHINQDKSYLTPYDYCDQLKSAEEQGRRLYGEQYKIEDIDRPPILKLLCYFLEDKAVAMHEGIDLNKGLLITGPVGCGKPLS